MLYLIRQLGIQIKEMNMNIFTISKSIIIKLFFVGLGLVLTQCDSGSKNQAVVVFASKGSVAIRDNKNLPLKRGMLLVQDDIIKTQNDSVDLQTSKGALIRIQKFTNVQLSELGKNTSLDMNQGSLMARVNRQDASGDFQVKTPTLIAGVRGTTFTVDDDGVRVVQGKVAIKPRLPALENKNTTSSELTQIVNSLDDQEKIIEEGQSGSIDPDYQSNLEHVNTLIEKNEIVDKNKLNPSTSKIHIVNNDGILKDKAEEATLVGISDELLEKTVQSPKPTNLGDQIADQYNTNRDRAIDQLEKETLKSVAIENEADIKKHYSIVEKVYTRQNGKIYTGAVLAQAGGILVVHTVNGLKRVPVSNVKYIDYF